jgi:hypothetical protein
VRTDRAKPGCLTKALAAFATEAAAATRVPLVALYSIAGDAHEIVRIWPWQPLDPAGLPVRDEPRLQADHADHLMSSRTEMFRSAALSPIR